MARSSNRLAAVARARGARRRGNLSQGAAALQGKQAARLLGRHRVELRQAEPRQAELRQAEPRQVRRRAEQVRPLVALVAAQQALERQGTVAAAAELVVRPPERPT